MEDLERAQNDLAILRETLRYHLEVHQNLTSGEEKEVRDDIEMLEIYLNNPLIG